MKNYQSEAEFERRKLEETVALAKCRLSKAKRENEDSLSEIISAKQEMREEAAQSVSNLWNSQDFEDLVALSQIANPIAEKLSDYEAAANRIAVLEKLMDCPYFARIDFQFEGETAFEKIYIGRASLRKEASYDLEVYDWRSPIAGMFYRFTRGAAFYEAPAGKITGEINLKRQYEIRKGRLEYFFDADIQIMDEYLRKMLSHNASPKMKTIVETIQKEQDIVIRDLKNDLMMVQGVAGIGKTSIALHRAAYLMYQGLSERLAADNIIIISPNNVFAQYISNVLPELGEENVVSVVFDEILAAILKNKKIETRNMFLERYLTNIQTQDRIKQSVGFKTSRLFLEILNRFLEDLPNRWIAFEDVSFDGQCIASKEALKNKVLTRGKTPLGVRLKQLEGSLLEAAKEYQKQTGNLSEYLRIKKQVRKLAGLDARALFRKLLEDDTYFFGLAKDLELPDHASAALSFTRENLCCEALSFDDAAVLAYLELKLNGAGQYKNIRQVIIDEAQDYYPLHYEIFNLLFPNAKFTVLGDVSQTLEKQADLSLYQQIEKILNKKTSVLVTLDKSFRSTKEILAFSTKFIPRPMEIKSFSRSGAQPEIHVAACRKALCDRIVSEAKSCLKEGYRSIGLICKTEQNSMSLYRCLKDKIEVKVIKNEGEAAARAFL